MIVGVLGAGQLGRMLGLAAAPLGISVRFYDEPAASGAAAPAVCIGPVAHGRFDDFAALDHFSAGCDAITYEFENVPVAAAEHLARSKPVWPPPGALRVAQDRVIEKSFYRDLGAGVPRFVAVDRAEDAGAAAEAVGTPCVLKTRRMGYDGKGQALVRTGADMAGAITRLGQGRAAGGLDLIAEAFVPFAREVSILGVRGRDGAVAFYPLVQNRHQHGILAESVAPALGTTPAMQAHAQDIARRAMDRLGYVGVLAIELFELPDGTLLVNEMAPRVHNSGHWTIEGAVTSQFENHMRAVAGLPLGSTAMVGDTGRGGVLAAMLNAVGRMPDAARVLSEPDVHVHDYGKSGRPGRKVGHVTVRRGDYESLSAAIAHLRPLVPFEVEA
jgi:5-(carboxyamino)imidazole ribonucleotide synthase